MHFQDIESRPTNPVILRVFAEEMTDDDRSLGVVTNSQEATDAVDLRAEVEVAVVIDDVINRKPKFLQNQ